MGHLEVKDWRFLKAFKQRENRKAQKLRRWFSATGLLMLGHLQDWAWVIR